MTSRGLQDREIVPKNHFISVILSMNIDIMHNIFSKSSFACSIFFALKNKNRKNHYEKGS